MRKGLAWLPVVAMIGSLIAVAGIVWVAVTQTNVLNLNTWKKDKAVACTAEAKICPDGSAVGRTGPNCAFAKCPPTNTNTAPNTNVTDATTGWKTYSNSTYGFSLRYPGTFADMAPDARAQADDLYGSVIVGTSSATSSAVGSMTLYVKNSAFDPQHISSIYGPIEAAHITDVSVGGKTGKMYSSGDAGCGSQIVQVALTSTKTMSIWFSDCDDGTNRTQFYTQTDLIKSILTTFSFTVPTTNSNLNTNSSTNTNSAQAEKLPTGVKRYTSTALGVSFLYKSSAPDSVVVQEVGDKIYLGESGIKPLEGQWVQVLTKTATSSLTAAITEHFLAGYAAADCSAKTTTSFSKPTGWVFGHITYPPSDTNSGGPGWENASKCPAVYTPTNGISYFAMDPAHPTKYLFFSIGQYIIPGTSMTVPWQDTIRVE